MYWRVLVSDAFSISRSSLLMSMGSCGITTAAFTPEPSTEGSPNEPWPWSIQQGMCVWSKLSSPSGVEV